ncbi:ArsR/SmtB family transcription factor [Arenicella xantha]|uniref:ArsR family transcriptional regulator n=1 Tax=Arenicella xantha TaxID=644221 RepID=A0A395JJY6_9GAMM|nr:helix-turn-helix domain-containing protein [Arenicella xantha]RBP49361.1 ArsR family transcriptional regulator [Arenicella xantha]
MIEATIYKALGDPIRLEIVKRLSITSTSTIGDISTDLGISRQGARKQLQVLVNANVVHLMQKGRQTHVILDTKTLQIASSFISQLERQWDNRLEALKDFVEESNSD